MLMVSFPVLAYTQYEQNPRVAGLLLSAIGGGQVVGSIFAYRLVTRVRPMRMAAIAVVATAAPLWLLVPDSPLWLVAIALALVGASIPMINAPYLGMLSTRIPRALRGKVIQSLITINQLAGPLGLVIAGPLFAKLGLHAVYAIIAVLASFASANFILAVVTYPVGPREPQTAA
jgi:predicted MFS family arabinose efflux permease